MASKLSSLVQAACASLDVRGLNNLLAELAQARRIVRRERRQRLRQKSPGMQGWQRN